MANKLCLRFCVLFSANAYKSSVNTKSRIGLSTDCLNGINLEIFSHGHTSKKTFRRKSYKWFIFREDVSNECLIKKSTQGLTIILFQQGDNASLSNKFRVNSFAWSVFSLNKHLKRITMGSTFHEVSNQLSELRIKMNYLR